MPAGNAVSPGLTAGGGLKRGVIRRANGASDVSPGLTAGGGLKLARVLGVGEDREFPPASPPGAD